MPELWERQPGETDRSWQLFKEYRDAGAGNRSYRDLAEWSGTSYDNIAVMGAKNNFVQRAEAWDRYQDRRQIKVREQNYEEFQRQVVEQTTAQAAQARLVVQRQLNRMLEALDSGEEENSPDSLDIQRLVNALDRLDIIQRRAAGLPTVNRTSDVVEPDYSNQVYLVSGDGE